MTIAYVDSAEGIYNSGTASSSLTFSFTVSSGSNRLLVVFVANRYALGGNEVTGITYNGDSLTYAAAGFDEVGTADNYTKLYYMVAPDTGTANVVVTMSGGVNHIYAVAAEFTGVDQSDPLNIAGNVDDGSDSPATMSVTPDANNCLVVGGFLSEANTLGSASNGTALQSEDFGAYVAGAMYQIQTSAAAANMQYSYSDNTTDDYCSVVAAFNAAGGAAQLTVQDISVGVAADSVSLTQHNVLSVASVDVALALDTLGLTQHNVLVVEDMLVNCYMDGLAAPGEETARLGLFGILPLAIRRIVRF